MYRLLVFSTFLVCTLGIINKCKLGDDTWNEGELFKPTERCVAFQCVYSSGIPTIIRKECDFEWRSWNANETCTYYPDDPKKPFPECCQRNVCQLREVPLPSLQPLPFLPGTVPKPIPISDEQTSTTSEPVSQIPDKEAVNVEP